VPPVGYGKCGVLNFGVNNICENGSHVALSQRLLSFLFCILICWAQDSKNAFRRLYLMTMQCPVTSNNVTLRKFKKTDKIFNFLALCVVRSTHSAINSAIRELQKLTARRRDSSQDDEEIWRKHVVTSTGCTVSDSTRRCQRSSHDGGMRCRPR